MKTRNRTGYVYLKSVTYEALAPPLNGAARKMWRCTLAGIVSAWRLTLLAGAFFKRPRLYSEEEQTKRGVHFKRFM